MQIQSGIIVKFHGPTDTLGSRWVAKIPGSNHRISIGYDYSTNIAGNIQKAAELYVQKYFPEWQKELAQVQSITMVDKESYCVSLGCIM